MEGYDKAIVEAAEVWAERFTGKPDSWSYECQEVWRAVQAKREAQKPRWLCDYWNQGTGGACERPAVQRIQGPDLHYRCALHGVTVTDL